MNSETILNAVKQLLPHAKSVEVDTDYIDSNILTLVIELYIEVLSVSQLSKALNLPNLKLDVVSSAYNKTILTFNF